MFDLHTLIGLALSLLVGVTLGLIGSGGSILTVPILVYIVGIESVLATAYSLFIVGSTALVGSYRQYLDQNINRKAVLFFGIPSMISVFITRLFLIPSIPQQINITSSLTINKSTLVMIVFSIVMLMASLRMFKKQPVVNVDESNKSSYISLISQGVIIGMVAGIVGAGGGFLIVPALLIFAKLPIKKAVGTSMTIVAIQSIVGFLGDVSYQPINWVLALSFLSSSIIGLFIGLHFAHRIKDRNLKLFFGYFLVAMALFILGKELIQL